MKEKEPIYWKDTRGVIHEIPASIYETGKISGLYERMGVITARSKTDLRTVHGDGGKEQITNQNQRQPVEKPAGEKTPETNNPQPVQRLEKNPKQPGA